MQSVNSLTLCGAGSCWRLVLLLSVALLPCISSLPRATLLRPSRHFHGGRPLRLRGGVDIKWTPSSDEPIAPFSKRARDAQAEAEGRDPSAQPPEPWSIPRALRTVFSIVADNPRETTFALLAATICYYLARIRSLLRDGWPVPLRAASPQVTLLRPRGRYVKQTLVPKLRAAEWNHDGRGMTKESAPEGFKEVRHRVEVGRGADDFEMAAAALRAYRMADAADWLSAHVAPDEQGDRLALVARTSLGYLASFWRVAYRDVAPEPAAAAGGAATQRVALGLASLKDSCFEGEVRLAVEFEGGGVDDRVWFEVVSYTRAARGAAFGASGYLQRLHRLGLLAMAQGMGGIVRQEAEMRSARNARQAAAAEQMHEAAAAEAGRKLQQLKDKQELKPKEWKRNNSGKGAA